MLAACKDDVRISRECGQSGKTIEGYPQCGQSGKMMKGYQGDVIVPMWFVWKEDYTGVQGESVKLTCTCKTGLFPC